MFSVCSQYYIFSDQNKTSPLEYKAFLSFPLLVGKSSIFSRILFSKLDRALFSQISLFRMYGSKQILTKVGMFIT